MKTLVTGSRALVVALVLCSACTTTKSPVTQIVVVVDSDLKVPAELDTLTIQVTGAVNMPMASADLTQHALPRSLGLVHSGGPLGPITVTVTGMLGSTAVVKRVAEVWFVDGQSLELRMPLSRACTGAKRMCSGSMTCDSGTCVPSKIDNLPPFAGHVLPFGTGADAGADAAGGGGSGSDAGADGAVHMRDTGVVVADGAVTPADTGTPPVNAAPVCTIAAPADNSSFTSGTSISFRGTCNDPETGAVTTGLSWKSDQDGQLSTNANFTRSNLSAATHKITFCARDPVQSTLLGCTSITLTVSAQPPIGATINSVQQSASSAQPFSTTAGAITAQGSGTGATPLTLGWKDSITGSLGTGASVMLASPPAVGTHVLTLTVTDAQARTARATSTFSVLAPGQTQLIAPYSNVNSTLAGNGSAAVPLVAAFGSSVYAADTLQHIYRFDASTLSAFATLAVDHPPLPDLVQALAFDATNSFAYIATKTGFLVCPFSSSTGIIDAANCTTYSGTSGNNSLPDKDTTSIVRMQAAGMGMGGPTPYLLIGTRKGVFATTTLAGSSTGVRRLSGVDINGLAASSLTHLAWAATAADGIYSFDPANAGSSQHFTMNDSLPSNSVRAIAVNEAGDTVWIATDAGIARYTPSTGTFTTWTTSSAPAPGLASNDVRDIKVARTTINATTRDVIWIATAAGISRFDPSVPSFTTFTTADGLPSDSVRSITIAAGVKVFGTDSGVAMYTGP
ncbi:MAG TPA: hypothetical protein VF331_01770 [Polyangiales bacterium]